MLSMDNHQPTTKQKNGKKKENSSGELEDEHGI